MTRRQILILTATAIACSVGLTAGNFVWQLMTGDPQWNIAVERSFFQLMAIAAFWWIANRNMRKFRSDQ
jgi:hypothetical protein